MQTCMPPLPLPPMTLAREKRIRKRRDFLRIQRYGTRSFGRFIVVIAQRDKDKSAGKIGITVPKKVGAAHIRNKVKRRIRHVLRINQHLFQEKFLVIVAKETAHQASFLELKDDLLEACRRLKPKSSIHFRAKNTTQFVA